MNENRRLKRWHLIYYLRVFNQDTGSLLGHIVDVSTGGMKVVSENPIPTEKDFRLRMEVPQEGGSAEGVLLNAHSLWCSKDANPDFYATGFRLVNPDRAIIKLIYDIIEDLSFSD